jgi:hypothetical protein
MMTLKYPQFTLHASHNNPSSYTIIMPAELPIDVLHLIVKEIVSGSKWHKTGQSLALTSKAFAQVIQPALFRHIRLDSLKRAEALLTLVSHTPQCGSYVTKLEIANVSTDNSACTVSDIFSGSSWATWFCSESGWTLLSSLSETKTLVIKGWETYVHRPTSKEFEELQNIRRALLQIPHLHDIRFEDCQFFSSHEPLLWASRSADQRSFNLCLGASNTITNSTHRTFNKGPVEDITLKNLYIHYSHFRYGFADHLIRWGTPQVLDIDIRSLLGNPFRAIQNALCLEYYLIQLEAFVRGIFTSIASLNLQNLAVRGVDLENLPYVVKPDNETGYHDSTGRWREDMLRTRCCIWATLDAVITSSGLFPSEFNLLVAVNCKDRDYVESQNRVRHLLPILHRTGRLTIARDDHDPLW